MGAAKRIVCYAINGSGLGHLTRLTGIARWLRRYVSLLENKVPEVLFLTSSDASDALAQQGFAAFKIPSKTAAKRADLDKLEYRRLAKHFVWNTLNGFAPDLLVVDTFPSGSFDELFQVLDGPFKKGFVFREVKPEYAARPTFRSAIGMYDVAVAPHSPVSGPVREGAPLASVRHCGEVIQFEREEMLPADEVRQRLGVRPQDRIVYVSAGGGGDPDCEQTIASLVGVCSSRNDLHLLVGAGPLYRGRRFFGSNLSWFETTGVWKLFGGVDAAVSAGGYNTFHELLFAGVPAAFYAQPKIADDQAKRIETAARRGACIEIRDVTDPDLVHVALNELLDCHRGDGLRQGAQQFVADNGARACALELLRPMYSEDQLNWAHQVLSPSVSHAIEQLSSPSAISTWLTTLVPQQQVRTVRSHPGFVSVLERLSPEAAQEVEAVLDGDQQLTGWPEFEQALLTLLGVVSTQALESTASEAAAVLADEVLKTLTAVIKKQPLQSARNGSYLSWMCGVIRSVQSLLEFQTASYRVSEVLQLYRVFPRIVDASAEQSLQLFRDYLNQQSADQLTTTDILRDLQILKVTQPKMTTTTIRETLQCATEQQGG